MKLTTLHSITQTGAALYIVLQSANADTLNREATMLYNMGYVCGIPDSYNPASDDMVCLPTNQHRLNKVAKALALSSIVRRGRGKHRTLKEAYAHYTAKIAANIKAQFATQPASWGGAGAMVYGAPAASGLRMAD